MEIAFFLSLSYCLFVRDDEVRRIGFKKSTYLPKKKKKVYILKYWSFVLVFQLISYL
jgi:hypothetical protein